MAGRSSVIRTLAVVVAVLFLNLDFASVFGGKLAFQRAEAQTKPRRVGLFVSASRAKFHQHALVLQTLMREQLGGLEGVQLVTGSPEQGQGVKLTAGPLVEAGVRALNDKKAAAAEKSFSQAYELLIRQAGPLERRLMARTVKGLGVAKVMGGKAEEGRKFIGAALHLWPDQQAPEYGYSLETVNMFREVERVQSGMAPGSIAVLSEPEGAEVRVGGTVKGYTPVTVGDLGPGTHWVQVQLDGFARASAFVDVQANEEYMQSFALQAIPDAGAFHNVMERVGKGFGRKATMKQLLPALKNFLAADEVIVLQASPRGAGYTLAGWHLKAAGSVKKVKSKLRSDSAFLQNIQGFLGGQVGATAAPSDAGMPLDAPPQTSIVEGAEGEGEMYLNPDDPIFKKRKKADKPGVEDEWWFWTIIGTATVGLLVGGYFLFTSSESGKGPVGDVVIDFSAAGQE